MIFFNLRVSIYRRYHNTDKLYFIYFIVYFRKQKFKEREILINFHLKKKKKKKRSVLKTAEVILQQFNGECSILNLFNMKM